MAESRKNSLKKAWEKMNNGWTGAIFYCILGVLVAFSVHYVAGVAFSTELPIVTVSSESMVPTLNVGDIVMIKGENSYETGDIIVFQGWESEPIIHRIVAKTDGESIDRLGNWDTLDDEYLKELSYGRGKIYITKGDNNLKCDQCAGRSPVKEDEVYGKAMMKIPYLGWVKILAVEWFIRDPIIGATLLVLFSVVYLKYNKII